MMNFYCYFFTILYQENERNENYMQRLYNTVV